MTLASSSTSSASQAAGSSAIEALPNPGSAFRSSGPQSSGFHGSHGQAGPAKGSTLAARVYRLVDHQGNPHPVLDDLYDTLEAAWSEALAWWSEQRCSAEPVGIGVEVSTSCGSWRTLRHPAG